MVRNGKVKPSASDREGRRVTAGGRQAVQSIDRALDVLEALASRRNATPIGELAHAVGLHVSTVHRLLATLTDRGYVRQDPDSSRYYLGARIFSLANAADLHLDLRVVVHPYLERLMRAVGETASLVTATEDVVIYLDQVESTHLVKMFTVPGARAPMHCTANGKAILAFRPAEQIETLLSRPFERFTSKTLVTREELEAELATIRRQGYAIDNEEREEGVRCLAAPIFSRQRNVVGSISVSGPTSRMTHERVAASVPLVREVAATISEQLGHDQALR